jgi:hypothetical protein
MDWSAPFADALPYTAFLDRYANPNQRARWDAMHGRVRLDEAQTGLLRGFVRKMPVLVLNGAWCGDCINQVPIFDHFAGRRERSTSVSSTATPAPTSARPWRSTAATASPWRSS